MSEDKKNYLLNSVLKALKILDLFNLTDHALTLTDIAQSLGYSKSTCLNMIKTLESAGYLKKIHNTQTYRLGFKVLELGYRFRSTMPVIQYSLPALEELQSLTEEIVYLTTHVGGRVLYLDGVYPGKRMMAYSVAGKTLPMHCTGCGKAMMAFLPEDEILHIIDNLGIPSITQYTISDKQALLDHLETIRKQGYALDVQEESLGVKCVAMPIRNTSGYPVAAISISGTVISMKDEKVESCVAMLARVCNSLSKDFNNFTL